MDTDTDKAQEIPQWTSTRHKYLSEFRLSPVRDPVSSIRDSCKRRLARLSQKYPEPAFHSDLINYMEGIWKLNNSKDVSGKPILVQIEEGELEGLDRDEFEGFMIKCGLKKDESDTQRF